MKAQNPEKPFSDMLPLIQIRREIRLNLTNFRQGQLLDLASVGVGIRFVGTLIKLIGKRPKLKLNKSST